MQTTVIKSSWLALAPGMRMDARFWVAVRGEMTEHTIDPVLATTEQVTRAIAAVKQKSIDAHRNARAKRDQANALLRDARALEAGAFDIR